MILYPGIARVHPRVCSAWEARRGARVCEGRAACSAGARGAGRGAPLPPACLRTPRWRSSFRRACQPFQDSSPRAPPACPARRSAAATSGTMNARSRAGARGGGPRERTRRRRVATSGGQAAKRASGCGMRMRYSRIFEWIHFGMDPPWMQNSWMQVQTFSRCTQGRQRWNVGKSHMQNLGSWTNPKRPKH